MNMKDAPVKGGMRIKSRMLSICRPFRRIQKYHSSFINTLDMIDLNNTIMHVFRVHNDHFAQASDIANHVHTDFSTTAQLLLVVRILRIASRFFKNKADASNNPHVITATSLVVIYILYADI